MYLKKKMFLQTLVHQYQIMGLLKFFPFSCHSIFFPILGLAAKLVVGHVIKKTSVLVGFNFVKAAYLVSIDHLFHHLIVIVNKFNNRESR